MRKEIIIEWFFELKTKLIKVEWLYEKRVHSWVTIWVIISIFLNRQSQLWIWQVKTVTQRKLNQLRSHKFHIMSTSFKQVITLVVWLIWIHAVLDILLTSLRWLIIWFFFWWIMLFSTVELPIARRKSLKRFFEKRHSRWINY